jgi:undecaprenyl pyrophosphate synthase
MQSQSDRKEHFRVSWPWLVGEHVRMLCSWIMRTAQRAAGGIVASRPLSKHVAFVMDGNRRLTDRVRMPVDAGHQQGYSKVLRHLHSMSSAELLSA